MAVTVAQISDIAPEVTAVLSALLPNRGDLLVRTATGIQRLALGAAGAALQSNGLDVVYGAASGGGLHKDSHVVGGADTFTATDLLEAAIRRIRESGGATLAVGAVADGQYLQRVGLDLVGGTPTGGGTATAIQESGGTVLPVGSVADTQILARLAGQVAGMPVGFISHKVAHPGVLENTNQAVWTTINVTTGPPGDFCDLAVAAAVRVFYMIRYMADVAAGIKFRFVEGASIATWGGWGSTPGTGSADQTITGGDNVLDWGGAGWGHPFTRTLFLYAAKDGAGPFTLQFARQGTSGTARVNTGSFVSILRANELGF